jgi:hypothetical protein
MAPRVSRLQPRIVPSTEWTQYEFIDGGQVEKGRGGVYIEANQDTTCFSIRSIGQDGVEDLIHFCDWPELLHTIAQFMEDRAEEGMADDD